MVAEHEGRISAFGGSLVGAAATGGASFRDSQQQPTGFVLMVALHQARIEDLNADPGATQPGVIHKTTHPYARVKGRPCSTSGWHATPIKMFHPQSLIFINFVHQYRLTAPALPFSLCEPDFWAAMFAYADLARCQADFRWGTAMGWPAVTGGLYRQLRGRNY